jgi:predicted nicotinamide N-methyase
MSTGFTFDFLKSSEEDERNGGQPSNATTENHHDAMSVGTTSFCWVDDLEAKFSEALRSDLPYDKISLSPSTVLCRVREQNSVPQSLRNTDLVPGVYEGGLKVWECSVDLCRYLQENNVAISGHVLELGCGQGLPGCWVLKQASQQQSSHDKTYFDNSAADVDMVDGDGKSSSQLSGMVFSDFNEFVLHDVTIPNILLNNQVNLKKPSTNDIAWLSRHVALGFGDWNDMSDQILSTSSNCPSVIPLDGKFDMILAAETTYSSAAASDTAQLLVKHLKVDTGVAFIATKRYYFGVGGGSDAFKAALTAASMSSVHFEVETVMVYDNGAGNIRELLRVRALLH